MEYWKKKNAFKSREAYQKIFVSDKIEPKRTGAPSLIIKRIGKQLNEWMTDPELLSSFAV